MGVAAPRRRELLRARADTREAATDAASALGIVDVGGVRTVATDVGFGPCAGRSRRVARLGEDGASVLQDFAVPADLVEAAVACGALSRGAAGSSGATEYP